MLRIAARKHGVFGAVGHKDRLELGWPNSGPFRGGLSSAEPNPLDFGSLSDAIVWDAAATTRWWSCKMAASTVMDFVVPFPHHRILPRPEVPAWKNLVFGSTAAYNQRGW